MRITIVLFLMISFSSFSQTSELKPGEQRLKYFDSGEMLFTKYYPGSKAYSKSGYEQFKAFEMQWNFLEYQVAHRFQTFFSVGGNFSWKKFDNQIDNVVFEGDYTGGIDLYSSRLSVHGGFNFAFQFSEKFGMEIPIFYVGRYGKKKGIYYIDPGQEINQVDVVTGGEHIGTNKFIIDRKTNNGIRSGLNFVYWPRDKISLVFKMHYSYFGRKNQHNIYDATYNSATAEFDIPNTYLDQSSEVNFSIGVQFRVVTTRTIERTQKKKKKDKDPDIILKPKPDRGKS